jgi:maleate isomerase
MEGRLADSAAVILPGLPLASLAFGCTSATMVIGEEGVFARLRDARPEARPTTPVTAAFGARRLAVLTPYRADVNEAVRRYLEGGG